ncbi:glycosyltransferase family 31 protein [Saccharata proteae CBS 121410]|uniref:Glycosyltransferase family 31 protein n=1 Tax=Saccharata proteae CBS 121410 TaxID=1314787 RepID=A0A6A5YDL7_9PEZI|nr:glycosyltransferase family 31 protein [Saccharata proteae CBS 121410]
MNLKSPLRYARLDISVDYTGSPSTGALDIPFPTFHEIGTDGRAEGPFEKDKQCASSVGIRTPKPPATPPDVSHIIFGVATTLERLEASLNAFAHWSGRTGLTIYAVIEPASAEEIVRVEERAAKLQYTLKISESDAEFHDRYFSLLEFLHARIEAGKTQWIAIIDDDTFFPSMTALVDRLGRYDPSKPQYVGGLTEDFGQTKFYGLMAYGGGGVFLSVPLLVELYPYLGACSNDKSYGGDGRIAACIYSYSTTKLSWEADLHQTDIKGDPSGFYESGRRPAPLSIHHWKSWSDVDVVSLAAVESVCGYDCILQRFRFSDGWWLTNGYSVVKYNEDRPFDDIRMERTWDENSGSDFEHSLAPFMEKDAEKASFRLEGVVRRQRGKLRQFYVRRLEEGDQVLEVVWRTN